MAADPEHTRLRATARTHGHVLSAYTARCLYKRVGEHDLAMDALHMHPRPGWLVDIVGPHPFPHNAGELLDPRDIATFNEWGGVG